MSTKQLVWAIREREGQCCGQKIAYFLEKEPNLKLPVPNTLPSAGRKIHASLQRDFYGNIAGVY